jgi:hypothetical protein
VVGKDGGEIDPMINFFDGDNKNMSLGQRVDAQERCAMIVSVDKCARYIAIEYSCEQSGH